MKSPQALLLLLTLLTQLSTTGCGILVGNVKPVDEKSTDYGIADLSKEKADWHKLEQAEEQGGETGKASRKSASPGAKEPLREPGETPSEVADVAFQSKKTASIISMNSACRPSVETQEKDLHTLTNLLLLGMNDIGFREERGLEIQDTPALQTTIRGKLNSEDMMLRTVVLRRGACIYDLIYLARPKHFVDQEVDFSHFVASLRLK